jgi:hypothetical protein
LGRRIYLSCVKRGKDVTGKNHGNLYLIDWDEKKVLKKLDMFPLPLCSSNFNPRGGMRGWRGIAVLSNGHVAAANNDSVVFFDEDLEDVKLVISHPLFNNLHDISDDVYGSLMITMTGTDSIGFYDGRQVHIFPLMKRSSIWKIVKPWVEERGRKRFVPDPNIDYRKDVREDVLHFNTLRTGPDGSLYAIFNSLHMIARIIPDQKVIYAPPVGSVHTGKEIKNPHHMCFTDDNHIITCSSMDSSIVKVSMDTGETSVLYKHDGDPTSEHDFIKYGWLRGLCTSKDYAFAGCGRSTIIQTNLKTGELVDTYSFGTTEESTFSVELHPKDWK